MESIRCVLKEGIADNSPIIQKAIDELASAGGGRVCLPSGTYSSGTIVLKDNIELFLEKGCVLKAGDDFSLFSKERMLKSLDVPSFLNCDYDGKPKMFFLYAMHAKNIRISGDGVIDGNEEIFYGKQNRYLIDGLFYPRMPLIFMEDVENLVIENVLLRRSAFWTVHLVGCRYVFIDHVSIRNNMRLANCDGIDPDHCQNVEIKDCSIQCADDAIVFKNTSANRKYGDLGKVHVSHCDLMSTSGAIKFGSESCGRFHDIHVENINIHDSNRGISFQLRDDGEIDHCLFENIRISTRAFAKPYYWGYGEPVSITALRRSGEVTKQKISDITFSNLMMDCENGIVVYGEIPDAIENIRFSNVSLFLHRKSKWTIDKKDLRPCEGMMFIEDSKPNVLYLAGCRKISLSNFMYSVDDEYRNLMGEEIFASDAVSDVEVNGKDIGR